MSRRGFGEAAMLRDMAPLMKALREADARGEDVGLKVAPEFAKVFGMPAHMIAEPIEEPSGSQRPATARCEHGTLDPDDPNDPCIACAVSGPEVETCAHEDTGLHCEFCDHIVDSDTMVCLTCKEGVAGVKRCVYCQEVVA